MQHELYITPSWDWNPLESINGKATIMSDKTFHVRYPAGKIPRKSKEYEKTFICRRGCNTRTATYTEEFVWEDIYHGTEEDVADLIDRLKRDTKATRKRRKETRITEDDNFDGEDVDQEPATPRKRQKTSTVSTPRKLRTPSKLVTPSHKRYFLAVTKLLLRMLISI
jgi:origin recognition complex subunit 1